MNIVIIKYNAGNVQSVLFALERIGVSAIVTDDPELIQRADKVILPGVGEAESAMKYLTENGLDKTIRSLRQPVLGICLGLQLLCRHSEEGDVNCIGIFDNNVRKFESYADGINKYKVPHMGWNTIADLKSDLLKGIPESSYMYFVHSYYAETGINNISTTDYTLKFCSALHKDNFYGVQFHPEKSGVDGQKLLENFIKL